ncbi:hypothetical protein ACX06_21090 [Vibrio parahaemolyticus]|uniref:hypothetical protein n=1 Tax=Vibrio parahaemolyticus TaxID=670 RepID=UPI0006B2A2EB|nr:hypothetical protein [Vibrio parahaemolyticus]EGR2045588.1 hypothetical protein [Vibrio parahaemolyticus]KOY19408.1 hypothetical protein ACX06_21090 [Vibrio parahaemolyticus]
MDETGYTTIHVWVENALLPLNLQSHHWEDSEQSEVKLSVSPKGRLRSKPIYLESIELAVDFAEYLKPIFAKRTYREAYRIELETVPTTQSMRIQRWKEADSKEVLKQISN